MNICSGHSIFCNLFRHELCPICFTIKATAVLWWRKRAWRYRSAFYHRYFYWTPLPQVVLCGLRLESCPYLVTSERGCVAQYLVTSERGCVAQFLVTSERGCVAQYSQTSSYFSQLLTLPFEKAKKIVTIN
jgi:hypothetical protein